MQHIPGQHTAVAFAHNSKERSGKHVPKPKQMHTLTPLDHDKPTDKKAEFESKQRLPNHEGRWKRSSRGSEQDGSGRAGQKVQDQLICTETVQFGRAPSGPSHSVQQFE
jgi:hypothetical protein